LAVAVVAVQASLVPLERQAVVEAVELHQVSLAS
jgi:hypothetical protein